MAETTAHLVDHVIPPLPVRQWVLSVPKRLRWHLESEPRAISAVLQWIVTALPVQPATLLDSAGPTHRSLDMPLV
ncbi:MAG: hypothetical protein C1943_15640 [Halochromatium sp.]|nr:hypothetical protein [Halochromatium sp.]